MRSNSLKKMLEDSYGLLNLTFSEQAANNTKYYTIHNWGELYTTLSQLVEYSFVQDEIKDVFSLGAHFDSPTSPLRIEMKQYNSFNAKLNAIRARLTLSIELLENFTEEDIEEQLNVKLPDKLTLPEMSSIVSDIDFVFSKCHFFVELNDKDAVSVRRVDSGSIWFILGVSSAFIALFGQIVRIAFYIREKWIEHEIAKQNVRVYTSIANSIEAMEKEFTENIKLITRKRAEEFVKENAPDSRPDKITSLVFGIDKLSDLFFRGVEIHPSIAAPKEVAKSFPSQDEFLKLAAEKEKLKLDAPKELEEPKD